MASSSRSHQTLKNTEEHNSVEEDKVSKQEEEEEEDWLKLGLGLGNDKPCNKLVHGSNPQVLYSPSPPSQALISSHQLGLKLGLGFEQSSGLGPRDNEGLGSTEVMEEPSAYRNSLLGWSSDRCNYYHYYHRNDDNGMKLWPSCQIDSQGLPMVDPRDDSHHYCARRSDPHRSGLWFTLRSCTNRSGEALPQIPKAYIRVRDENMTVFMVKKYLVRKLGLSNEAEVDISCMGQSLSHIQTLKQVRDAVWIPGLVESLNSTILSLGDFHDMSINHIMSLLYRKHCFLN